jgi:PAS domain S-box-containing protein
VDDSSKEHQVNQLLIKLLSKNITEIYSTVCEGFMELFSLRGFGIAVKERGLYIITCSNGLNINDNVQFVFKPPDEISFRGKTDYTEIISQCSVIHDPESSIILIIKPGKKLSKKTVSTFTGLSRTLSPIIDLKRFHDSRYKTIFNKSPALTMVIDPRGKILEWNEALYNTYGFNLEGGPIHFSEFIIEEEIEDVRKVFGSLYNESIKQRELWERDKLENDREYQKNCYRELVELSRTDEITRFYNRSKDRIYDAEYNINLLVDEETLKLNGFIVSFTDITKRLSYRRRLKESEEKYRQLVEEKTKDIIFSLDTEGCFTTVNKNITEKLGYQESDLCGKNILDLLYEEEHIDQSNINRETFQENLNKVLIKGEHDIRLNAALRHKFIGESLTLQFKLDPVIENRKIKGVMGFATEVTDDPLRKYLKEEKQIYIIENKLTIADQISYRITRNLAKYFEQFKVNLIRLGLREIIVNAIEHGNLEISYDEKTRSLEDKTYQVLLRDRQKNPVNMAKDVRIEYQLLNDRVVYTILDEGSGFEYRKYLNQDMDEINRNLAQHGRGLMITKSIFDDIAFNEKGNIVVLTSFYQKNIELES